jgi:CarD family transcriptional regulator
LTEGKVGDRAAFDFPRRTVLRSRVSSTTEEVRKVPARTQSTVSTTVFEQPFKVGDKAVYPAHGVTEVIGIETREISGNKQTFYILKVLDTGMRIMVPTKNVDTVGLRSVIGREEVQEVYGILRSREISVEGQTWNRRYREYMEKIKTGSIHEIAEVMRDLSWLKNDKDLSFGERKMLDTARSLLVKELAVAKNTPETKINRELDSIFRC